LRKEPNREEIKFGFALVKPEGTIHWGGEKETKTLKKKTHGRPRRGTALQKGQRARGGKQGKRILEQQNPSKTVQDWEVVEQGGQTFIGCGKKSWGGGAGQKVTGKNGRQNSLLTSVPRRLIRGKAKKNLPGSRDRLWGETKHSRKVREKKGKLKNSLLEDFRE